MDFQYGHRHQQQQQQQRPEQQQQEQHQQQINMMTISSGLTRYRSAPSSYFASYLEDSTADTINSHGGGGYGMDDLDHFLNRFLPSSTTTEGQQQGSNPCTTTSMQSPHRTTPLVKQELQTDYSQPMMSQTNHNSSSSSSSMDCYSNNRILSSSNQFAPIKMATGGGVGNNPNSNLVRYNSSPAGLFANINIHNEYCAVSGTGNHGKGSSSSSSQLMSPISEIHETKAAAAGMAETTGFPNNSSNNNNLWEDDSTLMLSDTFLKGLRDDIIDDNKKNQNKAPPTTLLSRHLSLPNTISNTVDPNLSAMETLMQDSVLCKLRAKRGCATHPRSIAERVRRTRISERMRKLQELVPNMEKQTNTSDMLDLAVDYIKDLQDQVKTLSDNRAKCRCTNE